MKFLSINVIWPIIILLAVLTLPNSSAGELNVARMTCDYRVNPLGVDVTQPQLSKRFKSLRLYQPRTSVEFFGFANAIGGQL